MKFADYLSGLRRLYASRDLELALGRPATAAELDPLEKEYRFELPAELKSAFLTTNGVPTNQPFFARPGFLASYGFLSVAAALEQRAGMAKRAPQFEHYTEPEPRDPRIAAGWYCAGWLPFAAFGGGSLLLMLDASPGPCGNVGQVIAYTHDPDKMSHVAPSFEHFLADSLEAARADPDEFLQLY